MEAGAVVPIHRALNRRWYSWRARETPGDSHAQSAQLSFFEFRIFCSRLVVLPAYRRSASHRAKALPHCRPLEGGRRGRLGLPAGRPRSPQALSGPWRSRGCARYADREGGGLDQRPARHSWRRAGWRRQVRLYLRRQRERSGGLRPRHSGDGGYDSSGAKPRRYPL